MLIKFDIEDPHGCRRCPLRQVEEVDINGDPIAWDCRLSSPCPVAIARKEQEKEGKTK